MQDEPRLGMDADFVAMRFTPKDEALVIAPNILSGLTS
jgi:hypothetical protein